MLLRRFTRFQKLRNVKNLILKKAYRQGLPFPINTSSPTPFYPAPNYILSFISLLPFSFFLLSLILSISTFIYFLGHILFIYLCITILFNLYVIILLSFISFAYLHVFYQQLMLSIFRNIIISNFIRVCVLFFSLYFPP